MKVTHAQHLQTKLFFQITLHNILKHFVSFTYFTGINEQQESEINSHEPGKNPVPAETKKKQVTPTTFSSFFSQIKIAYI